ncbi:cell wall elongation regulator TseB-like domain-containing protein [Streptococcus gallinaceus]|uniref:Uncharacterized protein YpmB n=1 Tax=Streptococcus gallinaceus TaxID=165758 RepID=A0ABV2JJ88_9STRE|nr:DUF5590 domain-containing protein [Streptococcus gallinaceus]MCP1639040.1 uncharacterized protein YpmB [Streptococcus gallinaceus]MCP1769716.1 uncharacterized protein YpmB [Streptococcus gallinaceus]
MKKSKRAEEQGVKASYKQWLLGIFILFAACLFSVFFILESSAKPFVTAREKAVQVAKRYVDFGDIKQVDIYNGSETYYSIVGKNSKQEDVFVLVPKQSSDIFVYQTSQGISKEDAEKVAKENGATKIEKTVLGHEGGKTIWEVKSVTNYYLIEFETGNLFKKEGI